MSLLVVLAAALLVGLSSSQDSLPPSPCPEAYSYERDHTTGKWVGLISILTPARYSEVRVEVTLSSSVPVSRDEVGDLSVHGGQKGAMEATRDVLAGRRHVLQYTVSFPPGKPIPSLLKVLVNERDFCKANGVPANSRSQITLNSVLSTGVTVPQSNGQDFDFVDSPPSQPSIPTQGIETGGNPFTPIEPEPRPTQPPTTTTTRRPRPPITTQRPRPHVTEEPVFGVTGSDKDYEVDLSTCGFPTPRPNQLVVNGLPAVRGQWPWQTAMFKKDTKSGGRGIHFQCGGTLITRRHIITAAHCVVENKNNRQEIASKSSLVIWLGKHNLESWTEKGLQIVEAEEIMVHPSFNDKLANDLAVILLNDVVSVTEFVKPICLWTGSDDLTPIVGQVGMVAGWGYDETGKISDILRTASMPVVSQETCIRSDTFYNTYTSEFTLCAGFKNGTTVCNGDSGGGLVFRQTNPAQDRQTWFLRGVVSISMLESGVTACSLYNYVVFTDVAKYLPWIHRQLSKRSS